MRANGRLLELLAGFCVLLPSGGVQALQESGKPVIVVATVKPHPPSVVHNNFSFQQDRFDLEDQPLLKLIAFAYSVNPKQVVGVPKWVREKHWDLRGTTDLRQDATYPQEQELIRQLLSARFGLKFHDEQREMSSYALQIVRGGPRLTAAADAGSQPREQTDGQEGQRTETYTASSMSYFLTVRQLFMDRPLVDQTGLKGAYDFELRYGLGDRLASDANALPEIFTAIKEQLGLRFQPCKAMVRVLVVDDVAQPSAD